MNDVAVRLEHVDLLDGLDRLGVELLKRLLELLVVGAGPGGSALDLSPGGSLATAQGVSNQMLGGDRFGVVGFGGCASYPD